MECVRDEITKRYTCTFSWLAG